MKIFYSNMGGTKGLENYLDSPIDILISYYGLSKISKPPFCQDLFLDSGAFSAYKKKEVLDPVEYAKFIKQYQKDIFIYAGLDVIGDPITTWKNQKVLESMELNPLPCFHYKEPYKWLRRYVKKYDFIAIGGGAIISQDKTQLYQYLDECWNIIFSINPNLKVHGFGLQNEKLMKRYPWYSVDASSVHLIARFGGIYTPWGSVKINPDVAPKDLAWATPGRLNIVKDWVNFQSLGFSFEEAQEGTTEGTLKRCVISIKYFSKEFSNFKCLRRGRIGFFNK